MAADRPTIVLVQRRRRPRSRTRGDFQSDKGCQYTSGDYTTLADDLEVTLLPIPLRRWLVALLQMPVIAGNGDQAVGVEPGHGAPGERHRRTLLVQEPRPVLHTAWSPWTTGVPKRRSSIRCWSAKAWVT